jgi:Family of unknown function (DUF5763)
MDVCRATKKDGTACRAPAGREGLCYFHADPDRARSLGQIGGRKNRRVPLFSDLEVAEMSATELRNVDGLAIRLLLAGELGTREAIALAQLSNAIQRVLPMAELENRLRKIEQQLAEVMDKPAERDNDS